MKRNLSYNGLSLLVGTAALFSAVATGQAQDKKPNILFIMGDDIGWMQPSCYHRGLMVGETPNIDRIAKRRRHLHALLRRVELHRRAHAPSSPECTRMRAGMVMPQLPGAISYLRPGTPALAQFLYDLGYTTGEFGKNHLGDQSGFTADCARLPGVLGLPLSPGCDAAGELPGHQQQPDNAGILPPCKTIPIPGIPNPPGAVDPKTGTCMTPPRPVIWMKSSDGTAKNQKGTDEGPLTLERSKTVDEEISATRDRLPRPKRSQDDQQAVLRLVQPGAHARHDRAVAEVR